MPRPLPNQVVVLTGASSGIGRETAYHFARHGAALVLAARKEPALHEVVEDVASRGGRAIAVPTDVADPAQVAALAERAAEHFGRIDTWVNAAGVGVYGAVEQHTPEEMRRIVEVDLLGTMYGSRAALPHLRRAGGALINVSSVTGKVAVPLQSAYSAAKHGIVGFDNALRMELERVGAPVSVTTILPYGITTPFFNHARSKLGVLPRPTPPAYRPEAVAEAIVWAAEHPAREIVVGGAAKAIILLERLSPRLVEWGMTVRGIGFALQKSDRPDDGVDNLFAPAPDDYRVRGEFHDLTVPGNTYTRVFEFHPVRQGLAVAGLLLGLGALIRRGRG
jgi:short-subunit dehydrogenase